jgi:hypothetical protein
MHTVGNCDGGGGGGISIGIGNAKSGGGIPLHMWASRRPLVGLVATNYIQVIVEQIRYTSCVLQNKVQNVTSTYREKNLILGLEVCIILVPLLLVLSLLSLVLRLLPLVLQLFPQN